MVRIKQAVFTSARTDRGAGYQLVATSPDISRADQRELAVWGPSHDSLLETGADAVSLNFFPLTSGDFCISHTRPVGWEYSGRGGARVYTQCLVVPPEILRQFANHPLSLVRAAAAGGIWDTRDEVPSALESFDLEGSAPAIDQASLAQLVRQVGSWQMALLVQSALEAAGTIAVAGPASAEQLIAGLLDCLPIDCRTAISFSTGLRHSSRRPFHILALPGDPATRRQLARQPNMVVLDLVAQKPCRSVLVDNGTRLVEQALSGGDVDAENPEGQTALLPSSGTGFRVRA
jgi:hypothetical protein